MKQEALSYEQIFKENFRYIDFFFDDTAFVAALDNYADYHQNRLKRTCFFQTGEKNEKRKYFQNLQISFYGRNCLKAGRGFV